nr:hypothetical protein [Tanacetum cinerariifolium]
MSLEEAEKESTESDSDEEAHVTSSMVKSSKEKKLKKFDFVTEDGRHIYLFEKQINNQKMLEEEAKAEAAKQEWEVRKAELIDLLGLEDPLDKLNDLTNKKRKHADDIHDYFKATKRLQLSVEYRDHLHGTVLNESVLGLHDGKRLLYAKKNKAISLGKGASKVSKEVHSLFLKGLYLVL